MSTLHTVVSFWGGFGGWLGIAYAVYLHRMRPPHKTDAVHILGVFAIGFAMLMTSAVFITPFPDWVSLAVVMTAYTLLILAETALFGQAAAAAVAEDLHEWGLERPYFVRGADVEPADDADDAPDATTDGGDADATTDGGDADADADTESTTDRRR